MISENELALLLTLVELANAWTMLGTTIGSIVTITAPINGPAWLSKPPIKIMVITEIDAFSVAQVRFRELHFGEMVDRHRQPGIHRIKLQCA